MATDVDHSYYGWSRDDFPDRDDTEDASAAQMLDHGSISFGRFAVEPLAWEKRSVFKHDRYQDELEKFKAPGLVAQKKAYFEEYYKRIRALKALQRSQQNELRQQTEVNLDYGNTIISSEAGEEVETSIQPQNFEGVSSALSVEESNDLCSLQRNDYGSALLMIPLDQGSIDLSPRNMEFVELEKNGDSACDTAHALLVTKSEQNHNEIDDAERKYLPIQETSLCDVGCEIAVKEIETEAESSMVTNSDSNACCSTDDKLKLIMEKSWGTCPGHEVIAPVRTDSKSDLERRPVLLKSSQESKPHAQLVGKYAKLGGKVGSRIVLNKTSNSLSSNARPASSYSQRSSTVSKKPSANRLPIEKRPTSSYSRRPLPQLVGKDETVSSTARNSKVLNNPAATRLQINMIRPSSASSQRPLRKPVDKDEKLSGRTENNKMDQSTVNTMLQAFRRPASASSQRPPRKSVDKDGKLSGRIENVTMDQSTVSTTLQTFNRAASASSQKLQLVSKNKTLSEKGGRSAASNKPTAGYPRPGLAASRRSLSEENPSITVPRAISFATERRGTSSSARDSAKQISSRAPQPSHLMVQAGSKKTAINGMQGCKAIQNRNSEDIRKETSEVVKHDGDRGRSVGVNHVNGTQTARSLNLPARRMPYPTVAMQKGFVKKENYDKVLIQPKVLESASSTSRPDKTTKSNGTKETLVRSKEPPAGARRPLTADSSHCRITSRKEPPIWR